MTPTRIATIAGFIAALAAPTLVAAAAAPFDEAAVRGAANAYVEAWLANDPQAVLDTLTDDAVLLPAHGRPAVAGREAIAAFWFPPSSPAATVDAFTSTIDDLGGAGDLAWARGSFDLTFTYEGTTTTQHGTYLMIFRRGGDGRWRISHRMWDDVVH